MKIKVRKKIVALAMGILISFIFIFPILFTVPSQFELKTEITNASLFYSGQNLDITTNLTLDRNVTCSNLVIDQGVVLNTNGYSIICSGNLTNYGEILTGWPNNGGIDYNATNYPTSYGGSGGGASYSNTYVSVSASGSTKAPGGFNDYNSSGTNGSSTMLPQITVSLLHDWYFNGNIQNYLVGGGGAGGIGYYNGNDAGESGAYGVYIQAYGVKKAGIIKAEGCVTDDVATYLTHGGGGGGVIVIAYGSGGFFNGTIAVNGSVSPSNPNNFNYSGGAGGNGHFAAINYGKIAPVTLIRVNNPVVGLSEFFISIIIAVVVFVFLSVLVLLRPARGGR